MIPPSGYREITAVPHLRNADLMIDQGRPTRQALRGGLASIASSSARYIVATLAQVILGFLLVSEDFGVYALAIAVANGLQVVRDGGVRLHLSRSQGREFRSSVSPGLCVALVSAIVVGIALLVSGPVAASYFSAPALAPILAIFGLANIVGFVAPWGYGVLSQSLDYKASERTYLASAIIRYGTIVVAAALDAGPMSFAWGALAAALFETTSLWVIVRRRVAFRFAWRGAGRLFIATLPAAIGGVVAAISLRVDYLVLGKLASQSVTGFYFFGYQLVVQLVSMLNQGFRKFGIAGLSYQEDAKASGRRAAQLLLPISAAAFGIVALGGGHAMELIWGGRWSESESVVRILSAAMPVYLCALLVDMYLNAQAQYFAWMTWHLLRGAMVAASILLVSAFGSGITPSIASLAVGVSLVVHGAIQVAVGFSVSLAWRVLIVGVSVPAVGGVLGEAMSSSVRIPLMLEFVIVGLYVACSSWFAWPSARRLLVLAR